MFKVNNRSTRTSCEICTILTIKRPERRHWRRSGVFILNVEHISHVLLVFLLLILSIGKEMFSLVAFQGLQISCSAKSRTS